MKYIEVKHPCECPYQIWYDANTIICQAPYGCEYCICNIESDYEHPCNECEFPAACPLKEVIK